MKNKKIKRVVPKAAKIYFIGENEKLLQEIEQMAKDLDQSVSKLCLSLVKLGMPTMQHYAESLKDPAKHLVMHTTIKLTDEGGIIELVTQQNAAQ